MSPYRISINTLASKKEKFFWFFIIGVMGMMMYGIINNIALLNAPYPSANLDWERSIPFVPEFIIPYYSMFLISILVFTLPYTRLEFAILSSRLIFISLVSYVVFLLFPFQFAFPRPETNSFIVVEFLVGLLALDLPYNQFPSLHISTSLIYWIILKEYLTNIWIKIFVAIWFLLIALSVLFVYQHHFFDIITGVGIALLAIYITNQPKVQEKLMKFITKEKNIV